MKKLSVTLFLLVILALFPQTVLAGPTTCGSNDANYRDFVGEELNGNFHGVRAYISIYNDVVFGPCQKTGSWNNTNWASAWVSIGPAVGTPKYGDPNAIIQIGIIKCDPTLSCASSSNRVRYFVAEGGCGFPFEDQPLLEIVGNPMVSTDVHRYRIERGTGASDGWWYAWVDSTLFAQWPPNDGNTSCWATGPVAVHWMTEREDPNDGIGSTPSKETFFTDMTYKAGTGIHTDWWVHANLIPGCNNYGSLPQDSCTLYSADPGYVDGMYVENGL